MCGSYMHIHYEIKLASLYQGRVNNRLKHGAATPVHYLVRVSHLQAVSSKF